MLSFSSKVGSVGALLAFVLSACSSLEPRANAANPGGMSADEYQAAYQIASARCDRQTNACSSFASHNECIDAKLNASAADTQLSHCSNDVDPKKVQACVTEIERGQCGSGIARLDACKASELCPYVSEEGTL